MRPHRPGRQAHGRRDRLRGRTIHRLLEIDPKSGGFKRSDDNPLDCDLLVVDETSMVDVLLMQALMKATPDKAALLVVGRHQPTPVGWPRSGAGRCHRIRCRAGRCDSLRCSVRPLESRIITTAHRINQGSLPDLSVPAPETDFYFVQADEPEKAVSRIIELVKSRIPHRFGLNPMRDIQVLCPMNRGGVGAGFFPQCRTPGCF